MDKHLALHIQMQTNWLMYKLVKEQALNALHEVTLYENEHGYGFAGFEDTDAYRDAYTAFTDNDEGFKKLWHEWNELFDEEMAYLKKFCECMVKFTDGQIDMKTARQMATNPRYADEVEQVLLGTDE